MRQRQNDPIISRSKRVCPVRSGKKGYLMSRVNIRHKAKRYLCADLSHCNRVSLLSLVAVLTALTPALFASAETPAPIKISIFDFELEDYSAGAALIGETPDDAAQLKRVTNEARQLIA
jgi:hypothetical protein